jgi:hypothetical protein
MRTVRDLHREAMALAQDAALYRERGDLDAARELSAQALPLEEQAAALVEKVLESEPTRSILYQSAASLALQAGEHATAQRLVAEGLSGYPPPRVEQDLKDLFEEINFESHLIVRDEPLRSAEMQMSITGDNVGFGRVAYAVFEDRLGALVTLLERTISRLSGTPFREGGRDSWASSAFSPFLSAPRAGSFSITIELVQKPDSQTSYMTTGEQVIDDVAEGLQLVQNQEFEALEERIKDERYFVNFVSQSHLLAPDGERVKMVGVTTPKRQVAFTQTKSSFSPPTASQRLVTLQPEGPEVTSLPFSNTVVGILDAASASKGNIKLIPENGRAVTLWVHEGMDDAVRTYFNRLVEVRVRRIGRRNELERIDAVND